jgi:hypothetical protein
MMHYFMFIVYLTTLSAVKLLLAFDSTVIPGVSSRRDPGPPRHVRVQKRGLLFDKGRGSVFLCRRYVCEFSVW